MGKRHDFERNVAIIIGINEYKIKEKPLRLAVPDARLLSKTLSSQERGEDEVYTTLLLTDEQATHNELSKLLDDLEKQKINFPEETVALKENHRLLFYFSGHGYASNREINRAEENEQYLLSQDEKKLPIQELTKTLGKLPCRHVLLILDCCYSGAVRRTLDSQGSVYRTVSEDDGMSFRADYDRMWQRSTFTVITSAGYELALDSDHEEQKNSYFAIALRKALEYGADSGDTGSQKSDFNKDGIITANELCTYLQNSPQVSSRQLPQIYSPASSKERQGGQYIFLLPDFEPSRLKEIKGLESPYKGLLSYEQKDAPIFFGRKQLIKELFDRVYEKEQKLTVVIGVSGSGKSSLVKAGLIPLLKKHENSWTIGEFRPGDSPFVALFTAIKECLKFEDGNNTIENQIKEFHAKLEENARKCRRFGTFVNLVDNQEIQAIFNTLIERSQYSNKKILLFIDQFEELVTLCQVLERELFLKLLKQVLDKFKNLRFVLTVRADFEVSFRSSLKSTDDSKAKTSLDISQYWDAENARFYVDEMTSHELRQVIERPAALLYVDFESDKLVSQIIDQVKGMPGALPLLSFTLDALYQKIEGKPSKIITQKHYDDVGGVTKALINRANKLYEELADIKEKESRSLQKVAGKDKNLVDAKAMEEGKLRQEMLKLLMLRMISLQGGQLAKRPVPLSELEYPKWYSRHKNATAQIKKVCEQLKYFRLITYTEKYIEPAHDALILHWDKLQEWIEQEKGNFDLVLRDRLIQDVQSWQERKQQQQSTGLTPVLGFIGNRFGWYVEQQMRVNARLFRLQKRLIQSLNPFIWADFLKRSRAPQINAKQTSATKNSGGGYLWHNDPRLEQLRLLLYVRNSWLNVHETEFVRQSIIRKGVLNAIVFSWGALVCLITVSFGVWALVEREKAEIRTGNALRESAEANLKSDRQLEAALDILRARQTLSSILAPSHEEEINSLTSSIQSTLFKLLYGTQERNRLQLDRGSLYEVVFNPNPQSDMLATIGQDDIVRLWNSHGESLAPLFTDQGSVYSVAFRYDSKTPDSGLLAVGGTDSTVKFWEVQEDGSSISCEPVNPLNQDKDSSDTPCSIQPIKTSTDGSSKIIDDIEFSADGQLVAVVEQDLNGEGSHVKLWELQNRQYVPKDMSSTLLEREQIYWDVAFNPINKNQLATVGEGDSIKLWDIRSGAKLSEISTQQGDVYSIAFNNDGILMTGGSNGTVKRWRIVSTTDTHNPLSIQVGIVPDEHEPIKTDQSNIYSIAVSPRGKIATVGDNEVVQIWDSSNGSLPDGNGIQPLEGSLSDSQTQSVVFSPNGKQLATLASDNTVRLWDIFGRKLLRFHTYDEETNTVAFNADGTLLATAGSLSGQRNITLFHPSTGGVIAYASITSIEQIEPKFQNLIFLPKSNPQEEKLAAVDRDGGVVILTVRKEGDRFYFAVDEKSQQLILESIDAGESGLQPYGFESNIKIENLVFSADGSYVAMVKNDSTVELKEFNQSISSPSNVGNVSSVAISPNNQQIVTAGDDSIVKIWNIQDWLNPAADQPVDPLELNTQQGRISSLIFNPLNSHQLVTGGADGTVRFWDLSRNQPQQISLIADSELKATATSANGNRLAILTAQGRFNLWNVTDNSFKANLLLSERLNQHSLIDLAETIVLSSTGKYLAIIRRDGNTLLWDVENDRQIGFVPTEQSPVKSIEFAPNDDHLAVIRGGEIEIWMLNDGQWQPDANQNTLSNEQNIVSVSFNRSNSDLITLEPGRLNLVTLSEDGSVKFWNAEGEQVGGLFRTDQKNPHVIVFSPDGEKVATGAAEDEATEGTVRVWDLKGNQAQQFRVGLDDVKSITFSHNAKKLAIIAEEKFHQESLNNTVQTSINNSEKFMVFDLMDGNDSHEPINLHTQQGTITNVMFTSDGNMATLSPTGQFSLWYMNDAKLHEGVCHLIWDYVNSVDNDLCQGINEPLAQSFSAGEKLLVDTNSNVEKVAGIQAIATTNFPTAIAHLDTYLKNNLNDPEARIYLNNARIADQRSYTIAVSVPIGSDVRSDVNGGLEVLRGVAQAQELYNKRIRETKSEELPLRVLIADDRNDPEVARAIANQLADNPDVLGVVGHFSSNVTRAAAEIYNNEELAAISPISTSVELSNVLGEYVFRTVPSDEVAAKSLADYMIGSLNKAKAVIFYNSDSEYSKSLTSEFRSTVISRGGQIIERVDLLDPNFVAEQAVEAAVQKGAEVLVLMPNTAVLDKALEVVTANAQRLPLLAGDDVYGTTILNQGGEQACGLVTAIPWHILANMNTNFSYFSSRLWRDDVNWRTAMAYDATEALIAAIRQAPTYAATRESVAQALRAEDFTAQGATGEIQFSEGDRRQSNIQFVQIRPGVRSSYGYDFVPVPKNAAESERFEPSPSGCQ